MRKLLLIILLVLLAPASARAAQGVGVFYYPWYGAPSLDSSYQHWRQNNHAPPLDLATAFYPMSGPYSSSSPAVLDRQMAEISAAGADQVISSWWGWGSIEDQRLPAVVAAANAHGLEVAVHLEPYPGRTVSTLEQDVDHLKPLGIYEFYVYEPQGLPAADWKEVTVRSRTCASTRRPRCLGSLRPAAPRGSTRTTSSCFGGWTFGRICAEARALHLLCAPSVGPGYDAFRGNGDTRVKPRRNGATYDSMWRAALSARADLVTITSYNEWNEGTQIEPASTARRRAMRPTPVRTAYATATRVRVSRAHAIWTESRPARRRG